MDRVCEAHGHRLAGEMTLDHVRRLRGDVGKPEAANGVVKVLRLAFAFGMECGIVRQNPARAVRLLASVRPDGIAAWPAADRQRFEACHAIGTQARLAMTLLYETGQRRSDVVRFGPGMVRDGKLHFTQVKNARRKPVTIALPITPELQEVLDRTPCIASTFIATASGRPYAVGSFGNLFQQWCAEAGLVGRSAHGLRKASANRMAEAGATEAEIKAVHGWRTSRQASHYTAEASRSRLAVSGMARISVPKGPTKIAFSEKWDKTELQIIETTETEKCVEVPPGVAPGWTDLQSVA